VSKIELEPGEFICDRCDGRKEIIMNAPDKSDALSYLEYYYKCTRCLGTGKLDWINKVVKKKSQIFIEKRIKNKEYSNGDS